tara:strand:- start:17 stop:553 length:537 start_codon:yes stop_codon:yes gene_type:complete
MINNKFPFKPDLEEPDYPLNPKGAEWKAVMIRKDLDPSLSFKIQNYSEVQNSTKLRFHGEVVTAIYPRTQYLIDRAWRLGWINIKEEILSNDRYWVAPEAPVVEAIIVEEVKEEPKAEKETPAYDGSALLKKNLSGIRTALKLGEADEDLAGLLFMEKQGENRKGVLAAIQKRIKTIS